MKRKIFRLFFLLILLSIGVTSQAQVTIGSNDAPHSDAVLDLKSGTKKGFLPPRVELQSTNNKSPLGNMVQGMTVYNTATAGTAPYNVTPGYYYNDGTQWVRIQESTPNAPIKWFYMPSISFDTSVTGTATKDLYTLFQSQFNTPKVYSAGAPSSIPYIPGKNDMYYYILDYDANVFSSISIDANGKMTYTVTSNATSCSYINIVFVLK